MPEPESVEDVIGLIRSRTYGSTAHARLKRLEAALARERDAVLKVAEEMAAWDRWSRNPHVEEMPGPLSWGNMAAALRKAVGK